MLEINNNDEVVVYCIEHRIRTVPALAEHTNQSVPWLYKQLKKLGVSYKKDVTDVVDFHNLLDEVNQDWINSCGEQWEEVQYDDWISYNDEGSIEFGNNGSRRSVTHNVFKGQPYITYVFIPDDIPDAVLKGCGDDYHVDIEYKYVFVSVEGETYHSNNLKAMCERLYINYQAAADCVRGRTKRTNDGWKVKYTKDFYAA